MKVIKDNGLMSQMTMWQINEKIIIKTKSEDEIDAIEINMKKLLNGVIFGKMSLMTLMSSLNSVL